MAAIRQADGALKPPNPTVTLWSDANFTLEAFNESLGAEPDRVRHRRYGKTLQRTRRLYAHDEVNDAREGDRVRVQETRPQSRQKRWRVVEVLERAK